MIELTVLVYMTCGFHCPMIKIEAKPNMYICEIERKKIEDESNPDRTTVFCTTIKYEKGKQI